MSNHDNGNEDMMISEIMAVLGLGRAKVESLFENVEPAYKSRRFVFYRRDDVKLVARKHAESILAFLGLSETFTDASGETYQSTLAEEERDNFLANNPDATSIPDFGTEG